VKSIAILKHSKGKPYHNRKKKTPNTLPFNPPPIPPPNHTPASILIGPGKKLSQEKK
jgi:hypothetical protein